jgi:hypothetical protein
MAQVERIIHNAKPASFSQRHQFKHRNSSGDQEMVGFEKSNDWKIFALLIVENNKEHTGEAVGFL